MNRHHKRPNALKLIVAYKGLQALLLTITSLSLFLALKSQNELYDYAEDYVLSGKREIVKWFLEKILSVNPKHYIFAVSATAIYATLNGIEAVGLWYQKKWAKLLVVGIVGISIPLEIYELFKGISSLKLVVFLLNVAVFWYLLTHEID